MKKNIHASLVAFAFLLGTHTLVSAAESMKVTPKCDLSLALANKSNSGDWKYPDTLFLAKREGVAVVAYKVFPSGKVKDAWIEVSSGDSAIDQAAVDRRKTVIFFLPADKTPVDIENITFCDTAVISWQAEALRRERGAFVKQANELKPTSKPTPLYDVEARRSGEEGTVTFRGTVAPNGDLVSAWILKSNASKRLERASFVAFSQIVFPPQPVEIVVEQTYSFKLEEQRK